MTSADISSARSKVAGRARGRRSGPISSEQARAALSTAFLIVVPLVTGVLVARQPSLAIPLIALLFIGVWVAVRGHRAWWDLLVFVVGGVYLLNYGFSNLGIPGAVPIPLIDVVACLLMLRIATRRGFRLPASTPFLLAAVFMVLTVLRLFVDFPRYGALAIRDATLRRRDLVLVHRLLGYLGVRPHAVRADAVGHLRVGHRLIAGVPAQRDDPGGQPYGGAPTPRPAVR